MTMKETLIYIASTAIYLALTFVGFVLGLTALRFAWDLFQ